MGSSPGVLYSPITAWILSFCKRNSKMILFRVLLKQTLWCVEWRHFSVSVRRLYLGARQRALVNTHFNIALFSCPRFGIAAWESQGTNGRKQPPHCHRPGAQNRGRGGLCDVLENVRLCACALESALKAVRGPSSIIPWLHPSDLASLGGGSKSLIGSGYHHRISVLSFHSPSAGSPQIMLLQEMTGALSSIFPSFPACGPCCWPRLDSLPTT